MDNLTSPKYNDLLMDADYQKRNGKITILEDYFASSSDMPFESWLSGKYNDYPKTKGEMIAEMQGYKTDMYGNEYSCDAEDRENVSHQYMDALIDAKKDDIDNYEAAANGDYYEARGDRKKRKQEKKEERKKDKEAREAARKEKAEAKKELKRQKKSGEISGKEFRKGMKDVRKTKREAVRAAGGSTTARFVRPIKQAGLLPVRKAFILLIFLNVFDLAGKLNKLKQASTTKPEAKKAWDKILNLLWTSRFGGDPKSLITNIEKGAKKKPLTIRFKKKTSADGNTEYYSVIDNEYYNLDPVTDATAAAATSTPLLVTVAEALGSVATIVGALNIDKESKDNIIGSADKGVPLPGGGKVTTSPDGTTTVTTPDGKTITTNPEGVDVATDKEGNIIGAEGFFSKNKWYILGAILITGLIGFVANKYIRKK